MRKFEKYQQSFGFAYIDEATKKEIRRKLLKAVCIPGYQVPYSSPEMPLSRGWGTGGLHITLAIIGKTDVVKVIDQGSDASVNACNLRNFIHKTTGCKTSFETSVASLIQSRHRIPEEKLEPHQILIFQVPIPEPLRAVNAQEFITRQMHAEMDYAQMWVALYEGFVKYRDLMIGAGYPVMVHQRFIMAPSPIPRWDIPNLNMAENLFLFGAGREKRLYAIPPYTEVSPLEFEDIKFDIEDFTDKVCEETGYGPAFMDELYQDDGNKKFVINDSNFLDKLMKEPEKLIRQYTNQYILKRKSQLAEKNGD